VLSVKYDGGIVKSKLSLSSIKENILDKLATGIDMCGDVMTSNDDPRVKISAMMAVIAAGRYVNETQRITPDDTGLDLSGFTLLGDGKNGKS